MNNNIEHNENELEQEHNENELEQDNDAEQSSDNAEINDEESQNYYYKHELITMLNTDVISKLNDMILTEEELKLFIENEPSLLFYKLATILNIFATVMLENFNKSDNIAICDNYIDNLILQMIRDILKEISKIHSNEEYIKIYNEDSDIAFFENEENLGTNDYDEKLDSICDLIRKIKKDFEKKSENNDLNKKIAVIMNCMDYITEISWYHWPHTHKKCNLIDTLLSNIITEVTEDDLTNKLKTLEEKIKSIKNPQINEQNNNQCDFKGNSIINNNNTIPRE